MKKLMMAILLCLSFLPVAHSESTLQTPGNFHAEREGRPYYYGPYGCHGVRPIYSLWLNFDTATFTKVDLLCYAGDFFYVGERGILIWHDGKALFTTTERGHGDHRDGIDAISWQDAFQKTQGYFTPDNSDGEHWDEYELSGNHVVRW